MRLHPSARSMPVRTPELACNAIRFWPGAADQPDYAGFITINQKIPMTAMNAGQPSENHQRMAQ